MMVTANQLHVSASNRTSSNCTSNCVVCCQLEVSATSCSLVQRSPTDCAASLCVI